MPKPVILHISDTHRTEDEPAPAAEILQYLVRDLRTLDAAKVPRPNLIVVSGDLCQSAEEAEYRDTEQLIRGLLAQLEIGPEGLVIVPGNHDVHWPTAKEAMRVSTGTNAFQKDLLFAQGTMRLTFDDEEHFQKRLQNFRDFYSRLKGRAYPLSRAEAFTIDDMPALGLTIVGLSSLDRNHEHARRGEFHPEAIRGVSETLSKPKFAKRRVIAVWHHDLDWTHTGATDCLDPASLRLASTGPFHLALCGHTHRAAWNDAELIKGEPLPVVAAGSLCAGPRQRPESTPRSYNVVEVNAKSARVWVRIKRTRSEPWSDCNEFGSVQSRLPYFDVAMNSANAPAPDVQKGNATRIAAKNPFSASNAKAMAADQVISDYVWTSVADDAISTTQPQIIVGSRGSGKTALLLTMTEQSTPRQDLPTASDSIGLYCPMKLSDVTAFNGKGWMPDEERAILFRAFIATLWALALADVVEAIGPDATLSSSALQRAWNLPLRENGQDLTFRELRTQVRDFRNLILSAIAEIDNAARAALIANVRAVPLLRGGTGPLEDAAIELQSHARIAAKRWTILFDEVEFLNPWQQRCVYEYLANPTPHTSCKIATLPYAHTRALAAFESVLVPGEDYSELSLVLATDQDFHRVARGLWNSRQKGSVGPGLSLEEAWPEEDYFLVLANYTKNFSGERDAIEEELIADLPPARREAASKLRATDRPGFGDQYWRKYREPFKFRLAKRAKPKRASSVPLYWGWRQMLKACGNNPRQFLRLAETCWVKFWTNGLRPLKPHEQYEALSVWASEFSRRCATLPHRGAELKTIVDRLARRLGEALHAPYLANEKLSVSIEDCTQDQAEAIAIGIAYGFLVPRLVGQGGAVKRYPADNILMRLGYPVAVDNQLPLRQGECLRILTMRQLELSWWK